MCFDDILHKLKVKLEKVQYKRNQLLIVSGNMQKAKRALVHMGIEYINLNSKISEELMDIPEKRRSRQIPKIISDVLKSAKGKYVAFDRIEILYLPELQQDPLRLFEDISKTKCIILLWPGKYDNGILTFAEPWHREYCEYTDFDGEIINID